jgi:hypothetical protein
MVHLVDVLHWSNNYALGFTSDGAAVMCGRRSGVAARLKEMVPWMLSYHCANHRTALAAAHASDAVPSVKKAKEALGHVYRYFSNSAVRTENLKEIQRVLDMPIVKLQEAKDVRWLSHHQAVTAMLKCFPAVITTLEFEAEGRHCPTARGLVLQLRKFTFLAFLHMMADVLPHLKIMTQLFQTQNSNFSLVNATVRSISTVIRAFLIQPGPRFLELEGYILDACTGLGIEYTEEKRNVFLRQVFHPYIERLLEQLEDQFPDLSILKNITIMDPASISYPQDQDYLATYGDQEIDDLILHFTNLDGEAMRREWQVLRNMLAEKQASTLQDILGELASQHKRTLPNFSKIATTALVLAASSADCERGFSHMRLVKTYMRNRMSDSTLDALLLLAIEGPPRQDFPFDEAVTRWAGMRQRRVDVSH